jgi:hypothetical protein
MGMPPAGSFTIEHYRGMSWISYHRDGIWDVIPPAGYPTTASRYIRIWDIRGGSRILSEGFPELAYSFVPTATACVP